MSDYEYNPHIDLSIQKTVHEELESLTALFSSLNTRKARAVFVAVLYDDDGNVHTRHHICIASEEDRDNAILGLLEVIRGIATTEID